MTSAGLTDKRAKRALRAPNCKGHQAKLVEVIHFKEYKFKQRNTKRCTSALLKCSINKSDGPWAVDYIHGVGSIQCFLEFSSDQMIEVIFVIYFNFNPALTQLQKRPF